MGDNANAFRGGFRLWKKTDLRRGPMANIGRSGRMIGMKTFGASAPLKELQKKFGYEPDKVATAAKELLGWCHCP